MMCTSAAKGPVATDPGLGVDWTKVALDRSLEDRAKEKCCG